MRIAIFLLTTAVALGAVVGVGPAGSRGEPVRTHTATRITDDITPDARVTVTCALGHRCP